MSHHRHTIGLMLALALASACRAAEPATEVLVVINSDLEVGRELTELFIEFVEREDRDGGPRPLLSYPPLALSLPPRSDGTYALPLSYSVSPKAGVSDFRMFVTGRGPSATGEIIDIVERQAIGTFREGARLWMPIYLRRSCLQTFCREAGAPRGSFTCELGACIPVPDDELDPAGPGKLGPFNGALPAVPERDAGPKLDGGPDASPDSGPDASDADAADADADADADVADADADAADAGDADTGVTLPCGTWVATNKDMSPPANATSYGVEYNDTAPGTFNQFVCRVNLGGGVVVPGKGVFGYSCYYISLDNTTQSDSESFEVLVESGSCARMTPRTQADPNKLLATGTGASNEPLYSCIASEPSMGTMPAMATSSPLGRYDVAGQRCLFEWYKTTRASTGPFSVLTRD